MLSIQSSTFYRIMPSNTKHYIGKKKPLTTLTNMSFPTKTLARPGEKSQPPTQQQQQNTTHNKLLCAT